MTEVDLAETRVKARRLLEDLKARFPGQQVTLTEWMATGGIQVSVTWPFERSEVKKL